MKKFILFCAGTNIQTLPAGQVEHILVNVPDYASTENAVRETRAMFKHAGTKVSMLDSGGYQIHVGEKKQKIMTFDPALPIIRTEQRLNISPFHVIRAACDIEPTIITALDFPVRRVSEKSDQEGEFLKKLGFNVAWAIETARLREIHCPHTQLYIPVQCFTVSQFKLFSTLISGLRFEGLSMPVRNASLSEIALFLLHFSQTGVRRAHILGSTGFFLIGLTSYFARHFFEVTSLDSTTWREAAQHKTYLNPRDLSPEFIGENVLIDETLPMVCDCPFCENRTYSFIKHLPYQEKVDLLRCHNFWVTEKACEDLYANSTNIVNFEKFLRERSPRIKEIGNLIRCLSLIDLFQREDINVLQPYFEKTI